TLEAQRQAEAVFKTLNLTSKDIVSIQINGANVPEPKMLQTDQLARTTANFSSPVIGGEQTVRASVTLQISY
ncbi:MAG: SIMPL domain-containing protein, partial [Microcystaceae cyanobacterium]